MSFLIISVSSLNYPTLEHFSPLHFASNRPSCNPRDPTSPSPSAPCKKKTLTQTPPALSIAIAVRAPRQPFQSSAACLPRSEATPGGLEGSHKTPFPTLQHHLENKKSRPSRRRSPLSQPLRPRDSTPPHLERKLSISPPFAPRGRPPITASRENALLPRRSRPAVTKRVERCEFSEERSDPLRAKRNRTNPLPFPTNSAIRASRSQKKKSRAHRASLPRRASAPSEAASLTSPCRPVSSRQRQNFRHSRLVVSIPVEPTGRAYQGAPAPPAKRQAITYPCRLVSTQQFPNSSRSRLAVGCRPPFSLQPPTTTPILASRGQSSRVTACRPNSPGFARPNYQHRDRHVVPPSRQPSRQASQQVPRRTGRTTLAFAFFATQNAGSFYLISKSFCRLIYHDKLFRF